MAVQRTDEYLPEQDEFAMTTEPITARPTQSSSAAVMSGWEAANKTTSAGNYPIDFKFGDAPQIIKFIDPNGPFAVYRQHFLTQKTSGQRAYVSLGANDPLCTKLGSKPELKRAFSIINLSAVGGPRRERLIASPRLYDALHAAEFSPQGPLLKNYWAISKTGKMQTTMYHLNSVKSRDLVEDWGFTDVEAIEKAIADIKPFTSEDIKTPTWEELEAVAASLL